MAAEDAVFVAANAREEVRKSLERMEFHLGRGRRGFRGVQREVNFLDALGRQSARLGGATAGTVSVGATPRLGQQALEGMRAGAAGNAAVRGRAKSSVLAKFSENTMAGARQWTYLGATTWMWIANGSACVACLDNHGTISSGSFTPEHPSCLCFPENPGLAQARGVQRLSDQQLQGVLLNSNNIRFVRVGNLIRNGTKTRREAAADASRTSPRDVLAWQRRFLEMQGRVLTLPEAATGA